MSQNNKKLIIGLFICLIIIVIIGLFGFSDSSIANGTTVYVATDGSGDYNCDGVDDHIEINNAITYIDGLGGGTVHLKSGTFIINDSVILKSNVVLEGDNQISSVIKLKDQNNRASWQLIRGNAITNCTLQNFTLDGNKQGQSGLDQNDYIQGFQFSSSDNILMQSVTSINQMTDNFKYVSTTDSIIRDCTAKDSSHDGFYAGGCDRITFADNLAWHLGAHGVRFYATKNSIVERNQLYAGDYGIAIFTEGAGYTFGNNIYRDNYIDNTKFANFAAIKVSSRGCEIANETFIGNMIDTCWANGIYIITDGGSINNITIINNVINKMGGSGIYVEAGSDVSGIIARNNIIVNNGARWNSGYGIFGDVTSEYNNIWNSVDGSYGGGASAGTGDISEDPLFANPAVWNENIVGGVYPGEWGWSKLMEYYTAQEDFHLKSQYGRWNGSSWDTDSQTSPCVDAGDPSSDYSNESDHPSGHINMGAYGNTAEASMGSGGGDTTSPTRSNSSPSGTLSSGTTSTTISLTTNENSTCKYSTASGASYSSMPNTFSITGSTSHSKTITGLSDGQTKTYYVRCIDSSSNPNTDDYPISFTIAEPTANELIAHYNLNETSGTTASDSSGNNNNGTLINNPVWVNGQVDNGLQFNGTNNYVEIP